MLSTSASSNREKPPGKAPRLGRLWPRRMAAFSSDDDEGCGRDRVGVVHGYRDGVRVGGGGGGSLLACITISLWKYSRSVLVSIAIYTYVHVLHTCIRGKP